MANGDKTVEMLSQEWVMDSNMYEFSPPCITEERIYQYIYLRKLLFLQKCKGLESEMYGKIAEAYKELNKLDPEKITIVQ
jgi:hypothetical protein